MKIERISIRNFRRLEDVTIGIEEKDTVFVGPNNSGKTSATAIFRSFLGHRSFSIYDFTVSKIADFDAYSLDKSANPLPAIELDIWFKIDSDSIEFGRAFTLLPNLTDSFERLGIRLSYQVIDPVKLLEAFAEAYPVGSRTQPEKRLSEFLAQEGILSRHFAITYDSLQETKDNPLATRIDQNEGKSLFQNLIRVDFIDAQRNIDDEEGSRSNRLSNVFARYYRKNLEQAEVAADANKVIDENNQQLTKHYEKQFRGLMEVIAKLGVPSINDRALKLVSSLSPESALKGNTDLLYIDPERSHQLPELYNGLGFKNLIYMVIQAKDFHSQWLHTTSNRPLCQIIFIEEPEVHLHVQVQQTFINNIWEIVESSAKEEGAETLVPQLVVTTHSSHILDATDFAKVRYFRRCSLIGEDPTKVKILNATQVKSLRDFKPKAVVINGQEVNEHEALQFLKRYLRLSHCDLFFADAAILVEGAVEKLLMPTMIDKVASRLRSSYLTVLEIGGAFAHRFEDLLLYLSIPYLIITDLDSVSPDGHHTACRADAVGALTSNASLKELLGIDEVEKLVALTPQQRSKQDRSCYITFQQDITVEDAGARKVMRPRTIEESFVYQNFRRIRSGEFQFGFEFSANLEQAYEDVSRYVMSNTFKKTDFAMGILAANTDWEVPNYIVEGLRWLELRLHGPVKEA